MRILVEPSDYDLHNLGDIAMLRVAVSRLAAYFPNAAIQVLSDDPDALRAFCPQATPLESTGRQQWLDNDFLPERLRHRAPNLSVQLQPWLRNHAPQLVEIFWRRRLRRRLADLQALNTFTEAVSNADLVIVTGMGGVTDAFPEYAADLLETLGLAVGRRKYVAMVGQGFGPLHNPALVARARSILPRVNFIGLREERASRPLLQSLGVALGRMMTTGDDAIELAYQLRGERLGEYLGVNLRASNYAGVDQSLFEPLRQALQNAAKTVRASLLPVPISLLPGEADAETIRHLMPDGVQDGLLIDRPEAVIRQIQRCRLVVAGSYHAGVFALASGIPTVGLAKSAYYVDKFLGLSSLFGEGCQTVLLNDRDLQTKLESSITDLWARAERVRPCLLAKAKRQIRLGHEAYERLRTELFA
jgi:polysaccharide pyruvyl transferase WcaK-like protein